MSLTFYTHPASPFAHRVAIALREVGAEWKEEVIDLRNKPEWFVKDINPIGKVPALKLANGTVLIESAVITQYLLEEYGKDKNLLSSSPLSHAQASLFTEHWQQTYASTADLLRNFKSDDQASIQTRKDTLEAKLQKVEELLSSQSPEGPFFEGDRFTLPDILATPFAARIDTLESVVGEPFGKKLPRFQKWLTAIRALPSVQEATPDNESIIKFLKVIYKLN